MRTEAKPLKRLDPTWWAKRSDGYDQQNGRERLLRLKEGAKVTGWALCVDNEYRGHWPAFAEAKRRAAELSARWDLEQQ